MQRFEFHLAISPEQYLPYYQGVIRQVLVRGRDDRSIQFPASLLKPFVTPSGIHGDFVLTCDDQNKSANLQRLAP